MTNTINKDSRVDLRIHADVKELIERAARLTGVSISDFMISRSIAAAVEVVQQSSQITLSDRDFDRFRAAIEADESPNEAAMEAAQRYRAGRSKDGEYRW